jgi:dimethylaniline monooxygenase (N-oxide forming)
VLPYINRPYRNKWRDFICSYVEPEEDSAPATDFVVDLAPFPSKVLPSGRVVFPVSAARKDSLRMAGRDFRPDTVVFATGYTQKFGFLDKEYAIPGELEMRNVANPDDPTIGFVGFLRPGLGASQSPVAPGWSDPS